MSEEYIERGAAVKALVTDYAYAAADIVSKLPAADVVAVKHGRWISKRIGWVHCSECNMANDIRRFRYCPNCGAKMDGE